MGRAAPQRALGHADRPHARAPVHPGRRAHLLPPRSAPGRDHRAARAGPRVVQDLRPRAVLQALHAAREVAGHRGAVGRRPRARCTRRCARNGLAFELESGRRRLLRPEDRHRRRRTRSAARWQVATIQVDLTSCPSASSSSTSTPTGSPSGRSSSTGRSSARYERFIGDPHRALRRGVPDVAGAGAGARAADQREAHRLRAHGPRRACAPPASAPSSTTATRSSATASATRRSARCPTCSSSATARRESGTVSLRHRSGEDLGAVPVDRVSPTSPPRSRSRAASLAVGRS